MAQGARVSCLVAVILIFLNTRSAIARSGAEITEVWDGCENSQAGLGRADFERFP